MLTLGLIWLSSKVRQDEVTNSSPLSPSAAYSWESLFGSHFAICLTSSYPESWSSDLELRTIDLLACAEEDTKQACRLDNRGCDACSYNTTFSAIHRNFWDLTPQILGRKCNFRILGFFQFLQGGSGQPIWVGVLLQTKISEQLVTDWAGVGGCGRPYLPR